MLALNLEGKKEVLGLYIADNEGANLWLGVLTDLQNRGVRDILIASVDGLTGFPEAINTIYPQTEVQLCIVHQIRNSLRYVASKNQKRSWWTSSVFIGRPTAPRQRWRWMSWKPSGVTNTRR